MTNRFDSGGMNKRVSPRNRMGIHRHPLPHCAAVRIDLRCGRAICYGINDLFIRTVAQSLPAPVEPRLMLITAEDPYVAR